ncbi:MAG: hypothetical protein MJ211_09920 [Bacteroidales bacterium]|nr:hypothetical protein [Bacteroidales bacterium]
MANLTQIFKEILLFQDSIIVPEFGTFETSYQPAQLDEKTGVIYPPTKLVSFNASKKSDSNDILINFLINNKGITEEEAKKYISEFIDEVNKKLANNEDYTIDEVGNIRKNENGEIVFDSVANNLLIDNYGMDTVDVVAAQASNRTSKGRTQANLKTQNSGSTTVKAKAKSEPVKSDIKPKNETESKPKSRKLLKWLLILLPIVAIITLYVLNFNSVNTYVANLFGSKKTKTEVPVKPEDSIKTEIPVNNNNTNNDLATEVVADPETNILLDAGLYSTPLVLGDNFKQYYLIAGSFTSKQNAISRQKEIPGSQILSIGDQHRVYIGSSDSAQDIVDQYNKLKKQNPNYDLWLLRNSKQ